MPDRIRTGGFPLARSSSQLFCGHDQAVYRPDAHPPAPGLTLSPEDTMDDGYDRLEILIKRGTTINGAVVALCPDELGVVTADVCIDGPPVP